MENVPSGDRERSEARLDARGSLEAFDSFGCSSPMQVRILVIGRRFARAELASSKLAGIPRHSTIHLSSKL